MKLSAWLLLIFISQGLYAQEEERLPHSFQLSVYLDAYMGYDFSRPSTEKRLSFLYNHTRHNIPAVNLAIVSGKFERDRFRANMALQQGTYAQDNYANEPKALRWIHQANVGIALDQKKKIWLDAGVLPSHIGFESAITRDNLTLSRSIIAENSPYFETGAKLSWEKSDAWYFAFLYLNGWQRIRSIPGKNNPSFGTQASFRPSAGVLLNWSTFVGTDQPLEAGTSLYFSNMYGNFSLGQKWRLIVGVDVGKRANLDFFDQNWWGAALIAQYKFSDRFSGAFRWEYYHDPFQAIADSKSNLGVEAGGLSLNLDQKLGQWGLFRIEGRYLDSPVPLEQGFSPAKTDNFFVAASWSVFWN